MTLSPLAAATATAADYADAMLTARRARNWLFLLLLLMVIAQLTIFFLLRTQPHWLSTTNDSTATAPAVKPANMLQFLAYLTAVIDFLGIVLSIVLSVVLLLLIKIMLVGRLIGISKLVSSYIWCVLLTLMLFPWQAFLANPTAVVETASATSMGSAPPTIDWKIPGALYTWAEVTHPELGARFGQSTATGEPPRQMTFLILRWSRFVAFPVLALIMLLTIQLKSNRGLKLALGEVEPDVPSYGVTQ